MFKLRTVLCGFTVLGLAACGDVLQVDNLTDPDRDRVLARPADIENFIGATYVQIQNGTIGSQTAGGGATNDNLQTQLQVMGMENTSALANFAMGPRGAIPRTAIENTRNSTGDGGNFRDFLVLHRAARMSALGIVKMDALGNGLGSAKRTARARAFAQFTRGVALGNLALAYDSASIPRETDDPEALVPFSYYTVVMAAALAYIDTAIAIATGPTPAGPTADWFPLPATWINGQPLSIEDFVRFARSYKARFRASVARTPAERAAADWDAIIADANAGITTDFNITMTPAAGWDVVWPIQAFATGPANWHQLSQFWLGMADTSGGYDEWLGTTPALREPFLVVTPDRRFPTGSSCLAPCPPSARESQSAVTVAGNFTSVPYIRNRPSGEDQPGQPLQISMYDFYRSRSFFTAGRIGAYPIMTRAEIRLLAAEGHLRKGQIATAIALIDSSRTRVDTLPTGLGGGLPSLDGLADSNMAIPGGAACVPRVPVAPSYRVSACGKLWDALKWEYRMETMYTGYGMWYFAGRGWGDLPQGTALYWPVPYQEMDTRQQAFYSSGGVGLTGGAPPGNYGLFSGGVY
jgi:hypothetical protein